MEPILPFRDFDDPIDKCDVRLFSCCGLENQHALSKDAQLYYTSCLASYTLFGYNLHTMCGKKRLTLFYRNGRHVDWISFQVVFLEQVCALIEDNMEPIASYNYRALLRLKQFIAEPQPQMMKR